MSRLFPYCAAFHQGRMSIGLLLFLLIQISFAYKPNPTPWFCTDQNALDSTAEISQTLPSCLPGYNVDIEDVVYESTIDDTCSGTRLCSLHSKNTLAFACNHKQTCNVEIRHFRFHINSTCGSSVRFFTKYRCLPVIQEQKDYLCESSTQRRPSSGQINLSCERYYRLHITMAIVGISVKPQNEMNRNPFKCTKDTYWLCNYYIPDAYQNVCNNQLNYGSGDRCEIRYNDRPQLRECQYGSFSNFSLVHYSCIPGENIIEDLPRIDICSTDISENIPITHGLLHSPNYPQSFGKHLSCKKQIHITRESRLRLFMLEKSIEYSHELNIRLLNNEPNSQRTLAKNELFDRNITIQEKNEIVEINLNTNHVGGGKFLLYFQVDSRISEYAPLVLEADRKTDDARRQGKIAVKRDWGLVIGGISGLLLILLIIAVVVIIVRISKRRRAKSLRYLKSEDDHRQHLNASNSSPGHRQISKPLRIEHPHLLPNSPTIIPSSTSTNHQHRPTSYTSVINHGNLSDRESLLKQANRPHATSTNIDSFYEEIKDQQPQAPLALGTNHDANNYLEPKSFEERRKFFDDEKSSQPIRDHRENESRHHRPAPLATPERDKRRLKSPVCDAPMASTETLDVRMNSARSDHANRPNQPPPKIPPPRMDLNHPQPSAPPLHLLQNVNNNSENIRGRQLPQWNTNNQDI